jgi:membrane protein
VNIIVLFWAVTPLVSDMRLVLGAIFRKKPGRPFLLEKLFDIAISMVFLIGISAVAVVGLALKVMAKKGELFVIPGYLENALPFLLLVIVVLLIYVSFSPRKQVGSLMTGAIVTSLLWFAMRPAFHLFLTYNPGYGFAFGSFKSLFVVIIWIYFSLAVFLFGAEIAASMNRKETFFIRKLMEGKKNVPASAFGRYVVRFEKGSVIFNEGDEGNEMYSVLTGKVGIRKNDKEIAVVPEGKCFGEVAYLLAIPRVATAVALDDVELVTISNENISVLMSEFPEFVVEMLRDMTMRLRDTNRLVD